MTSAVRGSFRDNANTRAEAMSLIYGRHSTDTLSLSVY